MGALFFGTWPGSKRHPARDGRGKCHALPSQTIDSVFAASEGQIEAQTLLSTWTCRTMQLAWSIRVGQSGEDRVESNCA